jgi:hypothetical protein
MVSNICRGLRLKPRIVQPRMAYTVSRIAKGIRGSDQAGTTHLEAGRAFSEAAASSLLGNCSVMLILDMSLSGLSFITVGPLRNFFVPVPKVKRSNAGPECLHARARTVGVCGQHQGGAGNSFENHCTPSAHSRPLRPPNARPVWAASDLGAMHGRPVPCQLFVIV